MESKYFLTEASTGASFGIIVDINIFSRKILELRERLNLENIKNLTLIHDGKKLLNDGSPLFNEHKQFNEENVIYILYILNCMEIYLRNTTGKYIFDIYNDIEREYPQLATAGTGAAAGAAAGVTAAAAAAGATAAAAGATAAAAGATAVVSDTTINNIITRTVTIGENGRDLKFVFDIEDPTGVNREIATVYTLNINGENKLRRQFKYTQLYKSSGKSRQIVGKKDGISLEITDKWLPYDGNDIVTQKVHKTEDAYYRDLLDIFIYFQKDNFLEEKFDEEKFIKKFNSLLSVAPSILKYKRFISEDYAIASYLLSKFNYAPPEKTPLQFARQTTELSKPNKSFMMTFFSDIIPSQRITKEDKTNTKFYYEKYLKYKQKYLALKQYRVQHGGQEIVPVAPVAPVEPNPQNIDFNDPNMINEMIQQGRVIQPAEAVRMIEENYRNAPEDVKRQAYENYNRLWEQVNQEAERMRQEAERMGQVPIVRVM